jgi:hypothetical protein
MVTETQQPITPTPPEQLELFPEVVVLRNCSENTCINGHTWVPTLALAKCGYGTSNGWNGCGAPILAVKMENCPHCGEPVGKFRLRIDHTPPSRGPVPLCIPGSATNAEVNEIVLERNHYKEAENAGKQNQKAIDGVGDGEHGGAAVQEMPDVRE